MGASALEEIKEEQIMKRPTGLPSTPLLLGFWEMEDGGGRKDAFCLPGDGKVRTREGIWKFGIGAGLCWKARAGKGRLDG